MEVKTSNKFRPDQIQVTFFNRKPGSSFLSIEELFSTLIRRISVHYKVRQVIMPYLSVGIRNRWLNGLYAKKRRGYINHITGDVHYLALFLPRSSTVLTIHDCAELENQRGIKKFILWLFWFYLPVKKLKYITVISEATKSHLLRYVNVDPGKITVITNCLIGEYLLSKKPFCVKRPVILQVGITANKNIERVAEALHGISCTLMILGVPSPSHIEALDKFKVDYSYKSNITRDEVIEEYANCDMLIFVSLIEGFGLPIIEAQASGKPVITSNISSMPDTAGNGACFVNPFNVESIRSGILKIIEDEEYRRHLVNEGLENCKRFDVEKVSQQYIGLYKAIASNEPR